MKRMVCWLFCTMLLLSSCRAQSSPTQVVDEIHPELKNMPIYPNSNGIMEGTPNWGDYQPEGHTIYSYIAKTLESNTVEKYYEKNMPDEWVSLGPSTVKINNIKSVSLLYYKEDMFVNISIIQWTTASYLVVIDFSSDSNYKG